MQNDKKLQLNSNITILDRGKRIDIAVKEENNITLNALAAVIFRLIREEKRRQEIIQYILSEYDIDQEIVEKDIDELIDKLKNYKVIING